MLKGFRDFILRGNVVDLAVAVVIGAAFGAVVKALVQDFLNPLIGILGVKGAFGDQKFSVNGSDFLWGDFLNNLESFILVAAAIYFLVIVPMKKVMERRATPPVAATTRECPECVSEIPRKATRCAFCTAQVSPVE